MTGQFESGMQKLVALWEGTGAMFVGAQKKLPKKGKRRGLYNFSPY